MTAEEQIAEAIRILEDSLATDFMTDSVRDIMTRAVENLKERAERLNVRSDTDRLGSRHMG